MSDGQFFQLQLKDGQAKAFIVVSDLLQLGRTQEAWLHFQANSLPLADSVFSRMGGALASQLPGAAMPTDVLPKYVPGTSVVAELNPGRITCLPFEATKAGQVIASFAEFGSPPAQYLANISQVEGYATPDPDGAGTSVRMVRDLAPGTYYMNTWLQPGFPATQVRMYVSM